MPDAVDLLLAVATLLIVTAVVAALIVGVTA